MYDLVLTDAVLVDPEAAEPVPGGLAVAEGQIVRRLDAGETPPARRVLRLGGLFLMPGIVDPHVHYGLHHPPEEDFAAEGQRALAGGVTTVLNFMRAAGDYRLTLPPFLEAAAARAAVDFALHLGILTHAQAARMPEYAHAFGITSFKFYMGYRGSEKERYGTDEALDDDLFVAIARGVREVGPHAALIVHAEWPALLRPEAPQAPDPLVELGIARPPAAEAVGLALAAAVAKAFRLRLYAAHVSSEAGLGAARRAGGRTTLETCPHYLTLGSDAAAGALARVLPPLRQASDREALWRAIASGHIRTVGSDACPYTRAEKLDGTGRPRPQAMGFAEQAHTLPVLVEEGHHARGIGLSRIAALLTSGPARAFGLFPRKGSLRSGADADLVVFDPERRETLSATPPWHAPEGFCVYRGRTARGWPVRVFRHGVEVWREGAAVGAVSGRYLGRSRQSRVGAGR